MKHTLFLMLPLAVTLTMSSACKKKVVEMKRQPVASAADTTDAKGWSGLKDNIDPTSWQAKELN